MKTPRARVLEAEKRRENFPSLFPSIGRKSFNLLLIGVLGTYRVFVLCLQLRVISVTELLKEPSRKMPNRALIFGEETMLSFLKKNKTSPPQAPFKIRQTEPTKLIRLIGDKIGFP